jgi:hypothetical protein
MILENTLSGRTQWGYFGETGSGREIGKNLEWEKIKGGVLKISPTLDIS